METDNHFSEYFISSGYFSSSSISVSIAIAVAVILILALASITGAEVAVYSLSPLLKSNLQKNSSKKSQSLLPLLDHPEKLLTTLVVANTFLRTGLLIVLVFIFFLLVPGSLSLWMALLGIFSIILLIIITCEMLPKTYASANPEKYLLTFSFFLLILQKIFSPISVLFYKTTIAFNQKYFLKSSKTFTEDLSDAIDLASDSLPEEEDILKGIVKFGNITVGEILRPRIDVVSVDTKMSIRQVFSTVIESEYSRIPVYSGSFDNVKGILYVKDLLPHIDEKDNFRWQTLARPPYFVPETKKVKDLLNEFQTNKNHMAVVVDEYGGTIGIVTLEDILEEIVGEIADESDEDERNYIRINDSTYLFDGKTLLNDFHKILQTDPTVFDEIKGDADTLAGLILEIKGVIPAKNEQISYKHFLFRIESVDARRIKQIRVIINKKQ